MNKGTLIRKICKANEDLIMDLLKNSSSPAERLIMDILDCKELIILDIAEHDTVLKIMDEALNEKEFNVLMNKYGFLTDCKTQEEISNILGVSKTRIGQLEKDAIRKLRASKYLKKLLPDYNLRIYSVMDNASMKHIAETFPINTNIPETTQSDNTASIVNPIKLKIPLSEIGLPVRAYNCLKRTCAKDLNSLSKFTKCDLSQLRNLGPKSINEMCTYLLNEYNIVIEDGNMEDGVYVPDLKKLGIETNVCYYVLRGSGIYTIQHLSKMTTSELIDIGFLDYQINNLNDLLMEKYSIQLVDDIDILKEE